VLADSKGGQEYEGLPSTAHSQDFCNLEYHLNSGGHVWYLPAFTQKAQLPNMPIRFSVAYFCCGSASCSPCSHGEDQRYGPEDDAQRTSNYGAFALERIEGWNLRSEYAVIDGLIRQESRVDYDSQEAFIRLQTDRSPNPQSKKDKDPLGPVVVDVKAGYGKRQFNVE